MKKTLLSVALLSATLLSSTAFAQNAPAGRAPDTATASTSANHAGQWRASKLPGVNVYNDQNEKIGDINDVILDSSGKATKVIIGVGGFLGMGEHDVAIDFEKVKWMNEPARGSTTADTSAGRATTNVDSNAKTASDGGTRTTTGTSVRSDKRDSNSWYPDHAVVSATKDQLKSMPEFKY